MNTAMDEKSETEGGAGICFEIDAQEAAKRLEQCVNDAKDAITAKLEDAEIAVERLVKRSRYAVEDGIEEAAHQVRRNPVASLAIAFAAGAALAFLMPRTASKKS